jgi:CDP-diacylglycerol--serine O-phosphatidyltransferase
VQIKKHIPNFITCLNLLCGCIAVFYSQIGLTKYVPYFIFAGGIFDFFDGMSARWLKVHSELGKQLDSLADMITFGLVPGILMSKIISLSLGTITSENFYYDQFVIFLGFLITIFSALRLAKFNIDTRQTNSFIGLPTPANAFFIASLYLILIQNNADLNVVLLNFYFEMGLTLLLSYLLIAELPLFALKFKTRDFASNKIRYIFLVCSLILLLLFQIIAIPIIIFLYILFSIINNKLNSHEV